MKIKFVDVHFSYRKKLLINVMRFFIFLLCTNVFGFTSIDVLSQNSKINVDVDKILTVDGVFDLIMEQTEYTFIYQVETFKNYPKVHLKKGVIRANKLLKKSLIDDNFSFTITENKTIVIKEIFQQEYIVTGSITDERGSPIIGATIQIKGTTTGTTTNYEGKYRLSVPNANTVLVFSSVGYVPQEITVGTQTTIEVTLKESVIQLDEVVLNAGYYKVEDREKTGSISKIGAKIIGNQPISNPLQALQGRMSGVFVTQNNGLPGSTFDIRVRGQNSLTGQNRPFFIIDGVPFDTGPLIGATSNQPGGSSPLNTINPKDIESIEILKDADATAIYGSRGANGVVLITTKRGKAGKIKINIDVSKEFGKVANRLNVLNATQFREMRNQAFANTGDMPGANDYDLNGTWTDTVEYDWQDVFFGNTSTITNLNGSISGGSEQTQFLIGTGYRKETTVLVDDGSDTKASVRFSINHSSLNKKFNVTLTGSYLVNNNNLFNGRNVVRSAFILAPIAPRLYNDDGSLNWEGGIFQNPLAYKGRSSEQRTSNLTSNVVLAYNIAKGLTLKTSLGYIELRVDRISKTPISTLSPFLTPGPKGSVSIRNNDRRSWIAEPQLEYETRLGPGTLKALIGTTFQETVGESQNVRGTGYVQDQLLDNISSAADITAFSGFSEYKYTAIYARLNYGLKDKYFINITGRRDGSSRFGPGKQFGNFGAVGVAWIFSDEPFLKNNTILSFGKLRASYGLTGSDRIGEYKFLALWNSSSSFYPEPGLNPGGLFNKDYQWETNKKLEFALELGFFNNRIRLNTGYYRNRSGNQLVGLPLPSTTGFSSVTANLDAEVQNTGLEFDLNIENIKTSDFSWSTGLNLTIPKNKLISYPNIESSSNRTKYEVGSPLDIFYGYVFNGIDPATGGILIEDLNESGDTSNEDRRFGKRIGHEYYGGLQNNFKYKGFELDFLLQFVKQTGRAHFTNFNKGGGLFNQPTEVFFNSWQQPGDISDFPAFTSALDINASAAFFNLSRSDRSITDASYVRLKNVSLSYNLPAMVLEKLKIDNLRIYLQGQNLLTFTKYSGLDPEVQGLSLPALRVISIGVQLTF